MIIKRLTMHNFGVYAGTNSFFFHGEKPVVLIGGLNGRGKTTFLEAVLISLYGPNSFSYKESPYNSYGKYLRSFVNANDWSQETYVELEFQISQKEDDIYTVHREWNALGKYTHEVIEVQQNGITNTFLTNNWGMFIENILPSAISTFFFFDGEKIAELAMDHSNEEIKNSIRAMLGLSVLDTLNNDLNRIVKKTEKKIPEDTQRDALDVKKKEKDELEKRKAELTGEIENNNQQISSLTSELERLQNEYVVKGGKAAEEKKKLLQEKASLEMSIEFCNEQLLEEAGGALPLALVKHWLCNIKEQAEKEQTAKANSEARKQIKKLYERYLSQGQGMPDEHFIEFVNQEAEKNSTEDIYSLSDQSLYQLNSLLMSGLSKEESRTKDILYRKGSFQKKRDDIENYLELDINEEELKSLNERIQKIRNEQAELIGQKKINEEKLQTINSELSIAEKEYQREAAAYLEKIETKDEANRTLKYTDMALNILNVYSTKLQSRKVDILADTVTECYKELANKKTLIDHIEMDPETLELSYLNENGQSVPKEKLSAGEKQLMVISILWALAKCSKKKLPVIIDTPLSRLDSSHRAALVKNYFPKASEQTIILSTDTEITQEYYEMLKPSIGDEFYLDYDEDTKSTTIREGYFRVAS